MKSVTVISPTNRRSRESHNGAACMSGEIKSAQNNVGYVRPTQRTNNKSELAPSTVRTHLLDYTLKIDSLRALEYGGTGFIIGSKRDGILSAVSTNG